MEMGCTCRPSSLWGNFFSNPSHTSSSLLSTNSCCTGSFPPPPPILSASLHRLHLSFPSSAIADVAGSGSAFIAFRLNAITSPSHFSLRRHLEQDVEGGGNIDNSDGSNNNNRGGGGGGGGWSFFDDSDNGACFVCLPFFSSFLFFVCSRVLASSSHKRHFFAMVCSLGCFFCRFGWVPPAALARVIPPYDEDREEAVWEVRKGKWIRLIPDPLKDDTFVVAGPSSLSSSLSASAAASPSSASSSLLSVGIIAKSLWLQCRDIFVRLMLPEGFPHSVTSDYLDYSLWRGVQGVASQISGVLATQSLLYAVGLGKGAIPTAAAVNWVLKDGIGYLSKIFLSKYGRHFDVHPKGWRLFADLLENAAYGMEMLTPAFPHLFVVIGTVAGAGRSASSLIQAATRSCFCAGFAAQRNFAEVIAKGEAQGMVSKSIGIMLGIALANCIGSSTPLALASFGVVTWVHMFCNLKSYQSIQLRTLNPYRASLVFSEYLLSGQVPPIKEVNDEEPLFPAVPILNVNPSYKLQERSASLSAEAKDAAAEIEHRLQLGSKLSDVVESQNDVLSLFDLYGNEGYILTEHRGRFCVILKESSTPQDMLKSLFHVNYLYWLERNAGIKSRSIQGDCRPGGRLQISLEYVQREFNHVKSDGELVGWATDGLIARHLPCRICPG